MTSKTKKRTHSEVNSFVNTSLLWCLSFYSTIVTLLLFSKFVAPPRPACEAPTADTELSLPYVPYDESHFLALLTPLPRGDVRCQHLLNITSSMLESANRSTRTGSEATALCMDTLPEPMSPSNCRIYSIDPHIENVFFELKMGHMGCRVHIITNNTSLNYGRISNNSYLYPLYISVQPGDSHYSLDNFIGLMSHELKDIHIIKTGVNESEWRLLNTLYTSRTEAWKHIKQLRMVITVPTLTSSTREEVSFKYLLLKGLRSLQFHLVYSRELEGEKSPGTIVTEGKPNAPPDDKVVQVASKQFETIWLKA